MKLGIFLQHYFPYGGLQRDALRLAEAAKLAADTPVLIVSTWDGLKPEDIEVVELNSGGKSQHAKARNFAEACKTAYNAHSLDTAICFSRVPGTPFHFCGDPCYKERFVREKHPLIKALPRYRFLLESENALFGKDSDTHIFYLAASEIPAYKDYYPLDASRFTLLPPWLKRPKTFTQSREQIKQALTHELGISENDSLLLFVGSDFKRKGLDRAISALAALNDASLHIVACGKYSPTAYLQQAKDFGVQKQVHILGPRDDVPEWMYVSDLLIHPARQETAGMVLIEALTYKLPVLCTENCGYAAAVEEAGCKPLSKEASTEEIASRIQDTLPPSNALKSSIHHWPTQDSRYNSAELMLDHMRDQLAKKSTTFAHSVKNAKSVCLVGNASGIIDSQHGKLIDASDIVIRMNRGFPKKTTAQGSKTNILALSCKIKESDYEKLYGAPPIIWMTPKRTSIPQWLSPFGLHYYPHAYWEALYKKLKNNRPSTGVMVVDLICNYIKPDKLRLIGFDFKKTDTLFEKKTHLGPHNWALEREYVLDLIHQAKAECCDWDIVL